MAYVPRWAVSGGPLFGKTPTRPVTSRRPTAFCNQPSPSKTHAFDNEGKTSLKSSRNNCPTSCRALSAKHSRDKTAREEPYPRAASASRAPRPFLCTGVGFWFSRYSTGHTWLFNGALTLSLGFRVDLSKDPLKRHTYPVRYARLCKHMLTFVRDPGQSEQPSSPSPCTVLQIVTKQLFDPFPLGFNRTLEQSNSESHTCWGG